MKLLMCLLLLWKTVSLAQSDKVLLVFPVPSKSHFILGNSLARGLAQAGHEVTLISPFADENPPKNYRDVVLEGFMEIKKEQTIFNVFDMEKMHPMLSVFIMNIIGNQLANATLGHPNVQKLLSSKEHFDVIIIEQFKNKAINALQWYYNAPLILFSTIGPSFWVNGFTGNPSPPSYIPDMFLSYTSEMNFWQRTFNFIMTLYEYLNDYFLVSSAQTEILKSYFPDCPDAESAINNVSLVLLNSHESSNQPVPTTPNMIGIGGFHIKPSKELPKDLKHFMDNAKEGVVYFSMGSNIESSDINNYTKYGIIKALGKLKQKVLWKYSEELPDKPGNVKLDKWFPQQDILAHPNTKLFITHGGLLSTLETIYHGVPVLSLPVYGDQKMNAAKAQAIGYGLLIPFSQITEETLTEQLDKLLNDPKYHLTAKTRSALMHDRPIKPLDLAIYWTEFIARHRGAPHLRISALDLAWYQYLSLDVVAFLGLVSFSICLALYIVSKKIFRCCTSKSKTIKKD
uniref:UDP-glucuronosyltransferase n=1 Tax=Diabrotica virgifera virgifera TaxID=50390 RepID=A0A6P7FYG7_DIAVI